MSRRSRKKESMFEPRHLPLELWQEISARVPIKGLMRMRSVCKAWCSMIDSPYFARMHFKLYNEHIGRSKNNHNGPLLCVAEPLHQLRYSPCKFTLRHSNTFKKIDGLCETNISDKKVILLGSCNGLWLIEHNCCDIEVQRRVWNPCTRKSFRLPNDPFRFSSVSNYVIGFAPSTNDYKVVSFNHRLQDSMVAISVCSLGTNEWRTTIANATNFPNFDLSQDLRIQNVVFIKNASYWFELHPKTLEHTYLVSFDFDLEEPSFLKLPDTEEDTVMLGKFIFNLNDSIAVLSISISNTRIWILDKNHDQVHQWRLWLSTDTHINAINCIVNPYQELHTSTFYQHNTGTFLITAVHGKLISYNILNHQVQYLRGRGFYGFFDTYVENLVSHNDPKWKNCDIVSTTKARKNKRRKQVLG